MNRSRISPHVSIEQNKNGYWYALVDRPGQREKSLSLGTKSREEAVARVKDTTIEALAAHKHSRTLTAEVASHLMHDRALTCKDAAEEAYAALEINGLRPRTLLNVESVFNRFLSSQNLNDLPITVIQRANVDAFIHKECESTGRSTRKGYITTLRMVFKTMMSMGIISHNPADGMRVRTDGMTQDQLVPKVRHPFTTEEIDALLKLPERGTFWRCAIMISHQTGLRLGDIAALQRESLVGNKLRVFTQKSEAIVEQPISDELRDILLSIPHEDPDEKFFWPDIELRHACYPGYLSTVFGNMCKACGIKGKSFHCLRHTYAHEKLAAEKADIRKSVMSELMAELALERTRLGMGHADSGTTKGYLEGAA